MSSTTSSTTPVEDAMRDKLVAAFTPTALQIRNDSHLHAHHAPMQGSTSKETHFQSVPLPLSTLSSPERRLTPILVYL
ncbi:BolA domain protein [Talaromyces pinophilus]|uniref:BolA domain protein n=1 Tax=Talaromyces pinophilus TaxID=128442 RepID=A0A6V8H5D2_TALPI|nr:BolA domain protein [Talaromyces pinophilus]